MIPTASVCLTDRPSIHLLLLSVFYSVEIVMCILYRPHAHKKEEELRQSIREGSVHLSTHLSSRKYSNRSDKQLPGSPSQEQTQQEETEEGMRRTGSGNLDENVPLMTWAGTSTHPVNSAFNTPY